MHRAIPITISLANNGDGAIKHVYKLHGAMLDNIRYYDLSIIWEEPNCMIIHTGTIDASYLGSKEILNNFFKLKQIIYH